jgi:hypothetical protein
MLDLNVLILVVQLLNVIHLNKNIQVSVLILNILDLFVYKMDDN